MKWTKLNIIVLLTIAASALISNEGVVNAAAYIFIAFALYIVYKTWSRSI